MTGNAGAVQTLGAQESYLADSQMLGAVPAWVGELREAARARFAEAGLPNPRDEAWRFAGIQQLIETAFSLSPGGAQPGAKLIEPLTLGGPSWPRLVVVDGKFAPELSSLAGLPTGVRAGSIAAAVERDDPTVRAHLARHARYEENAFAALGAAFLDDGAYLVVPAEALVPEPVEILFVTSGADRPTAVHPRMLVIAEPGASVSVLEGFGTLGAGSYLANAVTEIVVGESAHVGYYRVQRDGPEAYHVATTHAEIARDGVLSACAVALGAQLSRHELVVVLDGSGADATLNGLYILGGRQVVDHHMVVEHAQPHCTSHELFNGVLDDSARAVFTGRILVRPGAQRTDAKQVNNNMLLSSGARADSQPQLEIYADDVKCTHGSTLGPIEDASLFYLRSRGLDALAARNLLTYGFAADIVARVPSQPVRRVLDGLVRARLGQEAPAPE
jgi:Fe-S cluster assembly protein SufD